MRPETSSPRFARSRAVVKAGVVVAAALAVAAVAGAAGGTRGAAAEKIAFIRLLSPGQGQLWTMNTDGSDQRALTSPTEDVFSPAWSPNGQEIAFGSSGASGNPGQSTIWLIKPDGSSERQLTHLPANCQASDGQPAWSPTGTQIAFVSDRTGPWDIYTINLDGSGLTNITNLPIGQPCQASGLGASTPGWAPQPNTIVFASDYTAGHDLGHEEIFRIHPNGSGLTQLTNQAAWRGCHHGEGDQQPAWSPNGKRIAFTADLSGHSEIYVMNANGGHAGRVTHLKERGCPAPRGNQLPAWSPDGKHITFTSDRTGRNQIYVMNTNGTNQHQLTHGTTINYAPTWQLAP